MSTQFYRKCCKCGRTAAEDMSVPFFRFPKPGKENVLKAKAWAIYCWPDQNWGDVESLHQLHKQSKVLCGRHFEDSCFLDSGKKKISRFAVPGTAEYVVKIMNTLRRQAELEGNISAAGHPTKQDDVPVPVCAKNKGNISAAEPSNQQDDVPVPVCAKDKPSEVLEARPPISGRNKYDSVDDPDNPDNEFHDNDPSSGQEKEVESDDEEAPYVFVFDDPDNAFHDNDPLSSQKQEDEVVPTVLDTTEDTPPEQLKEPQFSWQRESAVVPTDDAEQYTAPVEETLLLETEDGGEPSQAQTNNSYQCNVCSSEITHFLYTCLECSDFDLCGACEARGEHATHYVLRVPGHRSHGEVSAVRRAIRRILLNDGNVGNAGLYDLDLEFDVKKEPKEDPIEPELIDQSEIPHVEKDPTEMFVNESVPSDDLHKDSESFYVEQEIDKFQLDRSIESDSEIYIQHDSDIEDINIVRDQSKADETLKQQILSQISRALPPKAKNMQIVEPGGKVSTINMSDQGRVKHIPTIEQQLEIQGSDTTKQVTLTIKPLPIVQKDKEIQKEKILKRLLPTKNIPTDQDATEIHETEIKKNVVKNPLPILAKDKKIHKREILKRLEENSTTKNIPTTDDEVIEIHETEMSDKVATNPLPMLTKEEIQKREVLKIVEKVKALKPREILKKIEEPKTLIPIRTTILVNKNEGPRVLIPKSSIHRHMPSLLKRREAKECDSDYIQNVKSDTLKNPSEARSLLKIPLDSRSSLNKEFNCKETYKRSIELSKTIQESAKKMKVKEITLLPVPEYIKQKYEGSGRVSLLKTRPEEIPSTSTSQEKTDPDAEQM